MYYFMIYFQHPEFSFLLKERVCPLVIKLFSPSLKYRQGLPPPPSPAPVEKPFYPIVMRLLRIVSSLIKKYYALLVCILTSVFTRIMNVDSWNSINLQIDIKYIFIPITCFLKYFLLRFYIGKHLIYYIHI